MVIKLFIPEEHSDLVLRILDTEYELHAPHHAAAEFGNVLWKQVRSGGVSDDDLAAVLRSYEELPMVFHELLPDLQEALDIAIRYDRTVYDALYVALAQRLEARFVTADRRLYNALVDAYPATMLWVEDLPADDDEDQDDAAN